MSSEPVARPAPRDRLLGELLVEAGLLGPSDLERGLALQQKLGGRIGSVLMRIGAVSEDNLLQTLSRQLGLPVMGLDVPAPDEDAVRRLQQVFFFSRSDTIYAGTNEIQLNIISERGLGMPRG